ncbi:MAG: hypothetical protein ABGZ35_26045 [Planctomycetaceae bacterium]
MTSIYPETRKRNSIPLVDGSGLRQGSGSSACWHAGKTGCPEKWTAVQLISASRPLPAVSKFVPLCEKLQAGFLMKLRYNAQIEGIFRGQEL